MIKKDDKFWKEIRCTNCRKLLALEYIYAGRIMIKCKCGEMNVISYKTPVSLIKKLTNNDELILNRDQDKNRKVGDKI